jgi:hypothetical protein
MTKIYANDYLNIIEERGKNIFTINFVYQNEVLINSLLKTRIILGGTSSEDYKILRFKAQTLKTFSQFKEDYKRKRGNSKISINDSLIILTNLSQQLDYIIKMYSKTFIGYNIENIIVINESQFIYLGCQYLSEIYDNEMTLISCPFNQIELFPSPELLNINEIPSYIHYKSSYFSLGLFLLYILTNDDEKYNDYLKENQNFLRFAKIDEWLKTLHIKYTKLYFLLSRSLVEEPNSRNILFI